MRQGRTFQLKVLDNSVEISNSATNECDLQEFGWKYPDTKVGPLEQIQNSMVKVICLEM